MTAPLTFRVPRRPSRLARWRAAIATALWQAYCGLHGHDKYLHTSGDRVTLRCVACGHESPGWDTGQRAFKRTYSGDPDRHRLVPHSAALRARKQMRAVK